MSRTHPLALDRLRHIPGELLRSRDLRDEVAAESELLWWHQRAVHDPAGVVTGLEILTPKGGPVAVSPGVAYDGAGREIVLTSDATIDLPARDHALVLVLRRRGSQPPQLAWVQPARVDPCDGVVLARLPAASGAIQQIERRSRGTARPRVAAGATLAGSTAWGPWTGLTRMRLGDGLEVRISTRAAGFSEVPCYFAWLQWPRAAEADALPFAGFGLQHLAEQTAEGFTFRVVLAPAPNGTPSLATTPVAENPATSYARTQRLSVTWLGIEADHDRGGAA